MNAKTKGAIAASDMSMLAEAIAEADGPNAAFAAVADAADALIGHRLFTIMVFDADAMKVRRLYSSNADAYPVGGWKQKKDTDWGRHVLTEGQPYVGRTADDIRANFDDHALIIGLGLESIINIPVRILGRTIGTMNLLHEAGHYSADHIPSGQILAGSLVGPLCLETGR